MNYYAMCVPGCVGADSASRDGSARAHVFAHVSHCLNGQLNGGIRIGAAPL